MYSSWPREKKRLTSDKEARRKKQWQYRGKYINSQRLNKETWDGWGKKNKKAAHEIKCQKGRYRPYRGLWGCFLPSLSSR